MQLEEQLLQQETHWRVVGWFVGFFGAVGFCHRVLKPVGVVFCLVSLGWTF